MFQKGIAFLAKIDGSDSAKRPLLMDLWISSTEEWEQGEGLHLNKGHFSFFSFFKVSTDTFLCPITSFLREPVEVTVYSIAIV